MKKAKFEKLLEKEYKKCFAFMQCKHGIDWERQNLNDVFKLIKSYENNKACYVICVQTLQKINTDIRDLSKSIFVKAVCRELQKLKN